MDKKHLKLIRTTSLILALAVTSTVLIKTPAREAQASTTSSPISRPQDPAVLTGAQLPTMIQGEPISELRLFAFDGSNWTAIPFQVDELDSNGEYVASGYDDQDGGLGLLDANDELVFMGADSGFLATCADLSGPSVEQAERVVIQVQDSLNAETGYVYLYHDASLYISPESYVTWSDATQTITGTYGSGYTTVFGGGKTPQFIGIADMMINGSEDFLDRQHFQLDISLKVDIGFGCSVLGLNLSCTFTEEGSNELYCGTLWGLFHPPLTVSLLSGPVRAVSNTGYAFYGSRIDYTQFFPLEIIYDYSMVCPNSVAVEQLRMSFDLNNPSSHGINTYYDSNGSNATIDGVQDTIASTPFYDWFQYSGGTYGGLVTNILDIQVGSGTANIYYMDDSAAGGTGDGSSYGETGPNVSGAGADLIGVRTSTYILPTGTDSNVGLLYSLNATNPLTASAYVEGCEVLFLPLIMR